MNVTKLASEAVRSTRRYRTRALLMMLGVMVGISSLAVLTSIGEGTKRETMRRFKNMIGTFDTIILRPGAGRTRGMPNLVNVPPTLKFQDAEAIAADPQIKQVAEVQNAFDIDVKYRDRASTPAIFGVSPNWLALRSDRVAAGEFFTEEQNASLARVAVIGTEVKSALFPDEDPLGKTIRIADVPFQVIGLLESRGAGPSGGSLDDLILIPIRTSARRLFNRDFLTMLIAQVKDPDLSDAAVASVTTLLRNRHQLQAAQLDDFTITNPRAVMAQVTRAGTTLEKILTGVAILALLIGGIVIMSLMSISVAERRKEIGVRRSIGAARSDILAQFLFESALVALLGGLVGVLLGVAGIQAMARMQMLPPLLVWRPFAAAIGLSLAVGLLFGTYPALKAAQVDPVQALRS